ncbi:PIN domain-containing protein [Streptomyces sp. NPDC020917]|uniref:PIN domain-containing protein n=1 Tax=Streptomyces sp. NPDC020917 TaxID=3365102 RepID=UPI0037A5F400
MIAYLIDTSAYVHLATDPADLRRWDAEIETGAIGMCEATRAEILLSATGPGDRDALEADLNDLFGTVHIPKDVWRWVDRAQYKLTQTAQHRAVGVVDLVVCATAARHGLTILHRDDDFPTLARVLDEIDQHDVRR